MYQPLRDFIQNFLKLTDDEWEMLLPFLKIRKLKKHEYFVTEGEISNEVGFVLEGMLRHFYTKQGEEKTTYFYFENHFISSYISCVTHKPSLVTIEALSGCTLVVFPYDKMNGLFKENMTWQKFGRLLAEYLAFCLEERMVSLLINSPEERYLALLEGNEKKIIKRIPQHYIASYLGITRVSMSRIRNRIIKKQPA